MQNVPSQLIMADFTEEKLKRVEKSVIYYADKLGDIGTIRKNTTNTSLGHSPIGSSSLQPSSFLQASGHSSSRGFGRSRSSSQMNLRRNSG